MSEINMMIEIEHLMTMILIIILMGVKNVEALLLIQDNYQAIYHLRLSIGCKFVNSD